jgi:pimeloyl-ACP methyl ester carboxylesterase
VVTTDEPGITVYGGRCGTRANLEDLARATGVLEGAARELEAAAACCLLAEWHIARAPRFAAVVDVDADEVRARSVALAALAEARSSPVSPGVTAAHVTELAKALRRAARLYLEAENGASGLLGQLSRWQGWIVGENPFLLIGVVATGAAAVAGVAVAGVAVAGVAVAGVAVARAAVPGVAAVAGSGAGSFTAARSVVTSPYFMTIPPLPPRPSAAPSTISSAAPSTAQLRLPADIIRSAFARVPDLVNETLTQHAVQIEALLSGASEALVALMPGAQRFDPSPVREAARLADAVLRLGPDRPLTVVPAIGTSHPPAPRDLGDVADRLAALYPEVGGTPGTIRVEELDHLDGTRTWVVEIPGTQDTGIRGTNPMDMATNLRLMAGLPNDGTALVTKALEQAGVGADEPILMVGHSQGGMVAMALAGSSTFASRYRVAAVATLGSPVATFSVPRSTQVLNLEHAEDFIPTTDGAPSPDEPNRTTVRRDLRKSSDPQDRLAGHSTPDSHLVAVYARSAAVVDDDADPFLDGWRDAAAQVLGDGGATVTAREFTGVRSP